MMMSYINPYSCSNSANKVSLCPGEDSVDFVHAFPGLHLPSAILEVEQEVHFAHYHLHALDLFVKNL